MLTLPYPETELNEATIVFPPKRAKNVANHFDVAKSSVAEWEASRAHAPRCIAPEPRYSRFLGPLAIAVYALTPMALPIQSVARSATGDDGNGSATAILGGAK